MVGAFAVGKTSLVNRFVSSIFSEKYHTTIGVKISKKQLSHNGSDIQLMIWDIEGSDVFTDFNSSYLKGASGVIIVVDGTREHTISEAARLRKIIYDKLGDIPFIFLINKSDLISEWVFDENDHNNIITDDYPQLRTSAKNGKNVESGFVLLTELMLKNKKEST